MTITPAQQTFILQNHATMTNPELATAMGLGLTTLRTMCYSLGLKRMELQYWTDQQVRYLKRFYKKCGDKELAERFTARWPKPKGWTLKHIEKKRMYLKLQRTNAQLLHIKQKAIKKGVYVEGLTKTWQQRGIIPEGAVRMQQHKDNRMVAVIKIGGKLIHYNRWLWEQEFGPIPTGYNITLKTGIVSNTRMTTADLEMISDAELSRRNHAKSNGICSDHYVAGILSPNDKELRKLLMEEPALLEIKRQQIFLNRQIKQSCPI